MPDPALKLTPYEKLMSLPEGLTGEIINGQLHTQPRPSGPHARAESALHIKIGRGYDEGDGGPGGWWILIEPEVHLIRDVEVLVPDLAGWKRERMPNLPRDHRFEVVPDWVCEILSPSTASKDREIKMPVYAHNGVSFAWLIDPIAHTLEAFELEGGKWVSIGVFSGGDRVVCAPFEATPIVLGDIWV